MPIDCDAVNSTPTGLQQLARSSAWKKVVEASEPLAGDECAFSVAFKLRAVALFRLKMFDELANELGLALQKIESVMGDSEDSDKANITRSTEKIIALQLLLIEVRAMTGRGEDALTQLYSLQRWLCQQSELLWPSSYTVKIPHAALWWKWRVVWAVVNNLIKQRQWRQALRELQSLLREVQNTGRSPGVHHGQTHRIVAAEIIILSRMSRMLVQVYNTFEMILFWSRWVLIQTGAVSLGVIFSERAMAMVNADTTFKNSSAEDHALLTHGLVCFASDKVCISVWLCI
jgi:hypothetical protein